MGKAPAWALAFSDDGLHLAAGNHDGELWIWNLDGSAGSAARLLHSESPVRALAFSPDGSRLAAGGEDGAVTLWDWQGGDAVHLRGHDGWVESLDYHPDGQHLVSTGHDGTVRIWPVSPEATIELACERVSGDLSAQEWKQYVGEIEYSPVCPQADGRGWVQAERLPPPGPPFPSSSLLPAPSPPTIYYFEAIPGTTVAPGEPVLLRWDLSNALRADLIHGETERGVVAPYEFTTTLTETTLYRLRATNDIGTAEKELRITVEEE